MPTDPSKLTRIFSSPKEINDRVDEVLINGLKSQFPIEGRNFKLEVSNLRAEPKLFSHEDEKKAILESRSLTYPIKAHIKLVDKITGKVVDENPEFTLMDSFYLTNKHTILYKGNNYNVANQLQLLPGVYTRIDNVGGLETHFNTGSGRSFKVELDPRTNLFTITPDGTSSKIPIAPLLIHVFKVNDDIVSKYIPLQVWKDNVTATMGKDDRFISDIYRKMVSTSKQDSSASMNKMCIQIEDAMLNSKLSEKTTSITLGKGFPGVSGETLLLAMKNLVKVHTGERREDNRDSLQFKRVQNLPDFLITRFAKEHQVVKQIKTKIARELDRIDTESPSLKGSLVPKPFNKFLSGYLMDSHLVATPQETNPIESIENVAKVTVLGPGEGGISSPRGVPVGARDIDPSHLGIIDPSRTPESSHAGIDQRFTITARRDNIGNLYARVLDDKGKICFLSVQEMMNHTIGFPSQKRSGMVQAQIKGELGTCNASEVDYWLADVSDMYTITTNLVPFLNSNHPGRLTMAGKAIPQALSLVNREEPLVQTTDKNGLSFVKMLGKVTGTVTPVDGVVEKVSNTSVTIKDPNNKKIVVKAIKNLPFNMKGFHDDETPLVKEGDSITRGDLLFDNNYSKNGVLAIGKNLNVAYIPWKGYNHEDGLVISKRISDQLSSHHAYKVDYEINNDSVLKKSLIMRYFPGKLTREQLNKLDDRGFAKVGEIVSKGDPIFAVLEHREPTPEDKMLGRLHKSLINPYKLVVEEWLHDENGKVVDANTDTKQVRFILRSVKLLEIGDKLTGLHGNKGIVSLILPDGKMPYNKETGEPYDILLNPASVTSRVNLGQLMETIAAKIAKKTGKPYLIHNFSKDSNVQNLKKELEDLGISDTDEIVDPDTNKTLGKVLAGPQYFIKLYKTSDQNWSARNTGGYDANFQPIKGGEEGSKSIGYMEMLGLLGSNARKNLKEIATIKSESNQEYWDLFLQGQPLPKPKTTFVTNKFFNYLTGAGIKTVTKDGKIRAMPLTDRDIINISHGRLKNPLMLNSKNLGPDKGGLFDPSITGGIEGKKWSHYTLAEPIPNPLMERPIKTILGLSTKDYEDIVYGRVGVKKEKKDYLLYDTDTGEKIRTLSTTLNE
jgi:DNA-directed RNA polymerase subunit beta